MSGTEPEAPALRSRTGTGRIRWETLGSGTSLGYITFGQWLFQICEVSDGDDSAELELTSYLPGLTGDCQHSEDRGELEKAAERWLEEFTASLGAIFPGALRSEVESMRADKHQLAGDHEESGHDWQTERCYGAVEALDWVLSAIGKMTVPSANPAPAGEE